MKLQKTHTQIIYDNLILYFLIAYACLFILEIIFFIIIVTLHDLSLSLISFCILIFNSHTLTHRHWRFAFDSIVATIYVPPFYRI